MTAWLYALPELLVIVLAALLLGTAQIWLPRFVQRVPFLAPTNEGFEFSIRMQAPLFTLTALVLTFTLVEAERNFRQIDASVTAEASQINQLDRLLTRFDDPAAKAARAPLLAYGKAIVKEWPAMLKNGRDNATVTEAFSQVSRAIMAIEPKSTRQTQFFGEMLRSLDAIADSRDRRLDSIKMSLPMTYWVVVLFSVLMITLVSCMIPRTPFRTAVLTCQLAVLGAFVGFVFVMDSPFSGEDAVTPAAISDVVTAMERRQI